MGVCQGEQSKNFEVRDVCRDFLVGLMIAVDVSNFCLMSGVSPVFYVGLTLR